VSESLVTCCPADTGRICRVASAVVRRIGRWCRRRWSSARYRYRRTRRGPRTATSPLCGRRIEGVQQLPDARAKGGGIPRTFGGTSTRYMRTSTATMPFTSEVRELSARGDAQPRCRQLPLRRPGALTRANSARQEGLLRSCRCATGFASPLFRPCPLGLAAIGRTRGCGAHSVAVAVRVRVQNRGMEVTRLPGLLLARGSPSARVAR
jgi:hypothetical protein